MNELEMKLFMRWVGMMNRCYNPKAKLYKRYGGRGIIICDEWRLMPMNFVSWCLSNKDFKLGLDLDRIDNNGPYSPSNCRFVTRRINTQNTSRSRIWIIEGRRYPSCTEAALGENVHEKTIRNWCQGRTDNNSPPKANCSVEWKYKINHSQ